MYAIRSYYEALEWNDSRASRDATQTAWGKLKSRFAPVLGKPKVKTASLAVIP